MKTIIETMFFFLLATQICFAQWFWQHPLPQGNDLKDVWVLNQNTVFAVGDKGTLLRSTNAGVDWQVIHKLAGISEDIVDVQFINGQKGWLLANRSLVDDYGFLSEPSSKVLLTVDGGTSWSIITSFDSVQMNDVCFINENVGWMVGFLTPTTIDTVIGVVFKTIDGGHNWQLLYERSASNQDLIDDQRIPFWSIHFIDDNTGWVAGQFYSVTGGELLRTTDGGLNWNVVNDSRACIKHVQFVNSSQGWLIEIYSRWWGGYGVSRTVDGGMNWQTVFSNGNLYGLMPSPSLYFVNDSLGWISEPVFSTGWDWGSGRVHKTTDGGTSWLTDTLECPGNSAMHFNDETNGCVVGANGQILNTQDGGQSWIPRSTLVFYEDITSIDFVDENTGWVVGNTWRGTWEGGEVDGRIFRTTDGGSTWIQQLFVPGGYGSIGFNAVQAISDQIVYAAKGSIYKTTNGGNTWNQLNTIGDYGIVSLFFLDENIGFAGKESNGKIYKTINGGISWNNVLMASDGIQSVFFVNSSEGWAVGPNIPIYKTTDGGSTWQTIPNSNLFLKSVFFINSNKGWAVGMNHSDQGVIVRSSDGGYNWHNVYNSEEHHMFNSVFFNDSLQGFVVGYKGAVLSTTDGGMNWNHQYEGTTKNLTDIVLINNHTGWIVGEDGIILKTTTGGVTFAEDEKIYEVPTELWLSQNFPNPFNPSTKIKYSVPQSSDVVIKVFDILGNEIEILVNEEKPAGTYEIVWNAANLPSGIYFYQLKAGEYTAVKKMILLK